MRQIFYPVAGRTMRLARLFCNDLHAGSGVRLTGMAI